MKVWSVKSPWLRHFYPCSQRFLHVPPSGILWVWISPSHSSHSTTLVCALTLSQPLMATKPDSACAACTSLTTSNSNSRHAHLFQTASTSAVCYSAYFLDKPLPVRLSPQTPGNTTACQQSPSNTPSRTDGLPVPPHRLATGCGLLGASIS